ncbi:MAG: hypothetical protein ACXABY_27595 [Candidatus Thorarchaeota archaeon]|jgi:hypothetical protein
MKEFTVYKDSWVRGDGYVYNANGEREYMGNSALLNNEGNMCCLGFFGEACGLSHARMIDQAEPDDVGRNKHRNYPKLDYKVWEQFMSVNDNSQISDRQRQDRLRKLFKKIGYKVSFKAKKPKE